MQSGRFAATLAVGICPADVGRRVTIRHRLVDTTALSDVVGTLLEWDEDGLTVQRRDGREVELAVLDLVAAKVVAPEVSAYDAQVVAESGWPPEQQESLGNWQLRWTHGVTGRANSVRVNTDPGMPLEQALEQVTAWYAQRGTRPQLQLPHPTTYEQELDALGWLTHRRTSLLTLPTTELQRSAAQPSEHSTASITLRVLPAPTQQWLALLVDEDPATWPVLGQILMRPSQVRIVAAYDDTTSELIGTGRASAGTLPSGRGRWAGITSIETAPSARRRGVARAVMSHLANWAGEQGCESTYLQVFSGNAPAQALYGQLGFRHHHDYVYRAPPS